MVHIEKSSYIYTVFNTKKTSEDKIFIPFPILHFRHEWIFAGCDKQG